MRPAKRGAEAAGNPAGARCGIGLLPGDPGPDLPGAVAAIAERAAEQILTCVDKFDGGQHAG
jgi:hypothetical protein